MASPIQIVLNPEDFETDREGGGGGPPKDFFVDRDNEFRIHKQRLMKQLEDITDYFEKQPEGDVGYLKVTLRRSAWAKSHRPTTAIFKRDITPYVGGADIGVMLIEASSASVRTISRSIEQAENETQKRYSEALRREIPYPSRLRSEVGAIDRIERYSAADKRSFSLEQAINWLSRSDTGGGYEIELFRSPPPRVSLDALEDRYQRLFQSFAAGLSEFGQGLVAQRQITGPTEQPRLSVRLGRSDEGPILRLSPAMIASRHERTIVPFDPSEARHERLLRFLDMHPLVRRVSLPGVVVRSAEINHDTDMGQASLPEKIEGRPYPRIAIIDGGVGDAINEWVIDRWDTLADEDMDLEHGSFIGGLMVAGRALNGDQICAEADGAEIVDIAILPDSAKNEAFSSYYPDGIPQFFEEMENAVIDARSRNNVRIFNLSMNIQRPATPDHYSPYARHLDRIADEQDAIFFISAGNLDGPDLRPEWPSDDTQALAGIAAARNDGILIPAESVRNASVAALNPPGHPTSVALAPARYSRRGPGLRAGVKPDLAHVGGSGTPQLPVGHALVSILPDGALTTGCGTSYSTPIVAKIAASIDNAIEGDVSRETLLALLVHTAELPAPLSTKALKPIARHMVGFGLPSNSDQILQTEDHQITLVFATRIRQGQQLAFRFPWPASLVTDEGKCRGSARLTLVASPPIDTRYGAEFVRVNIEGSLQQETHDGRWAGRLESPYLKEQKDVHRVEAELIEHGLKWSAVKVYEKSMPRGVGFSSNWRLAVNYLTRAGEQMPADGVPFTAILTISDLDGERPIFNDMRQTLNALGVRTADIRTAARITPRV